MANKLLNSLSSVTRDSLGNPIIWFPGLAFFIFFTIISSISKIINQSLTREGLNSSLVLSIWLSLFALFTFIGMSLFFSSIFTMERRISQGIPILKNFANDLKKSWYKVFLTIILISLIAALIYSISFGLAFLIGKGLSFTEVGAKSLFIIIFFVLLIGIMNFFAFSFVFASQERVKFIPALKKSIFFAKINYLETLSLMIFVFVISSLLDYTLSYQLPLGVTVASLIESLIFYPFVGMLMARFVYDHA